MHTSFPALAAPILRAEAPEVAMRFWLPGWHDTIGNYPAYIFYLLLACTILMAVIRLLNPGEYRLIIRAAGRMRDLLTLFNEGAFTFSPPQILLDIASAVLWSIYLAFAFGGDITYTFPYVMAFTFVGFVFKMILTQFAATIFLGRDETVGLLLLQLLWYRFTALILLPLLFIGLYQKEFSLSIVLDVIGISLGILYLVWVARQWLYLANMGRYSYLYSFLYLCTAELSVAAVLLQKFLAN